jgi:5-methylcytosine-specific restriction enzyme subunit McrC
MSPEPQQVVPTVELREWLPTRNIGLSVGERDVLQTTAPSISVRPTPGTEGRYDLTPSSYVGALRIGERVFVIRPKIPIDRLLFMLSYTADPRHWRSDAVHMEGTSDLAEALVFPYTRLVATAISRGLLQGYRTEHEALPLIRGRIRFGDQLRRHFNFPLPVELSFDEYTSDVELNRILKAGLLRLRQLNLRSDAGRRDLRRFEPAFAAVSDVRYEARDLPSFTFTRLTNRYARAVAMAKLILANSSFEVRVGAVLANSLLFDMNAVFEDFVTVALREALGLTEREFPQNARGRSLHLDQGERVRLEPDLSWWSGENCIFIGDVKYKSVNAAGVLHPDIYQVLAYAIATNLPSALLLYAAGEGRAIRHTVRHAGVELRVWPIDVTGPREAILAEISRVADHVRSRAQRLRAA